MNSNSDVERDENGHFFLVNDTVQDFSWKGLTATVRDRETKKPRNLINNINGTVRQGELVALMGPSGCGKTTFLNVLARRTAASGLKVTGDCYVNGNVLDNESFERIISYVEHEDALIGSLTVEETLKFAADLSLPANISRTQKRERVKTLLKAFGIHHQAKMLIGTPTRKGISGGQKRRVSVASQLITCPKILFLDEPTSGLDSTASYKVISYARKLAKANNLIIIASIHQPSTATFQLFDNLVLLSNGAPCYFGPIFNIETYFNQIGHPIPAFTNPAEFILNLISTDFNDNPEQVEHIQSAWSRLTKGSALATKTEVEEKSAFSVDELFSPRPSMLRIIWSLLRRSFIKSYRDVVAYGIRIFMYLGLAIMAGTVWVRLHTSQESIQAFINAIFFGSGFMSFMAVAYVPAFLEDRATFIKERANGLYGAGPFLISNFIIGLPYLFLFSLLYSMVSYWLTNFQPTATAFFTSIMWIFLDLVAAESLVVLMTSIFPNFVISLALVAFANGLWMCVSGFLVSPTILNPFWKYAFHYIDYQAYVFRGMVINEFADRIYSCGPNCQCMYQTDLASQCKIRGTGVLETFGYDAGSSMWISVGILIGIIAIHRFLGWIALYLRKT